MRRLLRFLAFRRIAATWAALLIVLAVRAALSARPPGFDGWPHAGVRAGANAVAGVYEVAFALWLVAALAPLRWLTPWRTEPWLVVASRSVGVALAARGVWLCVKSAGALGATPPTIRPDVLAAVAAVTAWPLLAGAAPLLGIELYERLRTRPFVWRWLYGGLGAHSAWIAPYDLKKITRPIPRRLP